MNAVFTILTVLIILASLLLIGVVLLQNGKGEGLASNFVAGNQTFGVRQTADFLEKTTWTLMGVIALLCIVTTLTLKHSGQTVQGSAIEAQEQTAPVLPENVADEAPVATDATNE